MVKQNVSAVDPESPEHFTIDETATELRMSVGWVRRHIRDGKIPSIRLGHKIFIKNSVVLSLKNKGLPL